MRLRFYFAQLAGCAACSSTTAPPVDGGAETAAESGGPSIVCSHYEGGGNPCTTTISSCSDGHSYDVSCTNTDCTCHRDGQSIGTFTGAGTECESSDATKQALADHCGVTLF